MGNRFCTLTEPGEPSWQTTRSRPRTTMKNKYWQFMLGWPALYLSILAATLICAVNGHTWCFTKGRAWMQASLDKPFRDRVVEGGQVNAWTALVSFRPPFSTVFPLNPCPRNSLSIRLSYTRGSIHSLGQSKALWYGGHPPTTTPSALLW